jgi:hypothetical protein
MQAHLPEAAICRIPHPRIPAAGVRVGAGLEQADLQRFTFKQCFTADFQGSNPGILTQVQRADYCYSEAQKRSGRDAKKSWSEA